MSDLRLPAVPPVRPSVTRGLLPARHHIFEQTSRVMLILFVFVVPWQGAIVGPGGAEVSKVVGVLAAGTAGISLAAAGVRRPLAEHHLCWLGYMAAAVASWFWSIAPGATVLRISVVFQLVLMTVLLWEFMRTGADRLNVITALVAGASISAILSVQELLERGLDSRVGRASAGIASNANDVGLVLALTIPFAWYLVQRHPHRVGRALGLVHIPIALIGIVATASRGSLLVAIIALAVFPATAVGGAKRHGLIIFLGLPLIALTLYTLLPESAARRYSTIPQQFQVGEVNDRQELWDAAYIVFSQNPLNGVGGGASRIAIAEVSGRLQGAHNTYLSVAADLGLVGLAPFLLAIASVIYALSRLPRLERSVGLVTITVLLIGIMPIHWETSKALWIILAILGDRLAWEPTRASDPPLPSHAVPSGFTT